MTEAAIKWVPYRPSNGTEGGIFEERFCDRCKLDENQDCAIHTNALAFDEGNPGFPKEWVIPEDSDDWPGEAKCTAFVSE